MVGSEKTEQKKAPTRPRIIRYAGLAALTVLALALRLFRLGSVPLGAHGDVSWIGLNALDWLQSGIWPYYVFELYAPEPVIVYLAGLSIAVFGPSSFALRFVTALASAFTVPAGWAAARWLHPDADERLRERVAWVTAIAFAVGFYPIVLSKNGQRAQLFPLLLLGLTALFGRALKRGDRWAFVGTAVVMALANYTYIPARLLPVLIVLWLLWADRSHLQERLWPLVGMFLLSGILVLPQMITYIQTPEAFFAPSNQGTGQLIFHAGLTGWSLWRTLALKALNQIVILIFPWNGAYTEMGHPMLDPALAVGFVVAVALAIRYPKDRGLWWPLVGIGMMAITDVVSGAQLSPNALHMIGVMPFAFLFASHGLVEAWHWVEMRVKWRRALAWILILALALPGLLAQVLYHWVHVPARQADPLTATALEAADVFLVNLVPAEGPALITLDDFTRSNIAYLLSSNYPDRHSAVAADARVALPDGPVTVILSALPERPRHDGAQPVIDPRAWVLLNEGQMLLLPPLTPEAAGALLDSLGEPSATIRDWTGQAMAYSYTVTLPNDPFSLAITPVGASLNDEVELVGYETDDRTLIPGEPFWITLYWRALAGAHEDYETFVQIWNSNGEVVAMHHAWTFAGVYRTRLWRDNELTPMRVRLALPTDLAPGTYRVVAGLYRVLANEPVPILGPDGTPISDEVILEGFRVALDEPPYDLPQPEIAPVFGDTIRLAGWSLETAPGTLTLTTNWQALAYPTDAHTFFIHVTNAEDAIVAQVDTQPRGGSYPTTAWVPGEIIPDSYAVSLPADLPPGEYGVWIGWYTLPSGERLPATIDGEPVPDNRVLLTTIEVDQGGP
jgi:4-amino-4-deoxy-L-arabinose transferase-like glycosyltransferase